MVEQPEWNPPTSALWANRVIDADAGNPTAVMLRHPAWPFVRYVDSYASSALQSAALDYLRLANGLAELKLPPGWLNTLATPSPSSEFGWLPTGWSDGYFGDPMTSYWFGSASPPSDRAPGTLVLLASERFESRFLSSEFGIRVVEHVRWSETKNAYEVRIAGMSASLPFGIYDRSEGVGTSGKWPTTAVEFFKALSAVKQLLAGKLGVSEPDISLRRLRLANLGNKVLHFELFGTTKAKLDRWGSISAPPDSFLATGTASDIGYPETLLSLKTIPLVADASPGEAEVFPQDPPSKPHPDRPLRERRPTRTKEQLGAYREHRRILPSASKPLRDPGGFVEVVNSRFVLGDVAPGTKTVNLPGSGPAVRSNDFAAVSAHRGLCQVFDLLKRYGIDPQDYFRLANLPLKAVYRAGVPPGPGKDGQTVNARVLPDGWKADAFGAEPPTFDERPSLEVHLALANLSHRERKKWDGRNRSPAEPLGIAADPRWIWHEIGHVLLMAAVGELEFRFAHSAGDALAAIVSDPRSQLAANQTWRGATFPWVYLPRRHDRCVLHGWSWCGSLHRTLSLASEADRRRRKGYWSEQILSSSLFRLYRCLGGDTTKRTTGTPGPDVQVRESASHYALFLIIKAIGLLGYAGAVPAHEADQFVSALIDADVGTEKFEVKDAQGNVQPEFTRIGGCAHKSIRWAFEAQGMYAADPTGINNAPGMAEPVDIYIEDNRDAVDKTPYGDVNYGRGSYVPVSLDWAGVPKWHAATSALERQGNEVFVVVRNRGKQSAANVTVRVWWRKVPADPASLKWDKGSGWNQCSVTPAEVSIPGEDSRKFGPFSPGPTAAGEYLVFAEATCDTDRANTDPASGLPCSQQVTSLVDLVAGDNNLGLWKVTV